MDTKVAGQVARQMAQFFKVFKDVEEVLEAATQAETHKGEIARQIESLAAERAKLEGEVREVRAGLAASRVEYDEVRKQQELALRALTDSSKAAAAARQEKADAALAVTTEALMKAQKEHAEFLEAAKEEKAAVEAGIKALHKQFDGLKAKVAAL